MSYFRKEITTNKHPDSLDLDYASDLQLIRSMYEDDSFWERVLDAKLDFLNNGTDPHLTDCVRPEIADSWIVSSSLGIEPDREKLGEYVSKEVFAQAVSKNANLIQATGSLLKSIESLSLQNDYAFELLDVNGLSLIQIGDLELHQFLGTNYEVNEGNAGTNSHTLCMRYKRPFVVIGPEHYCFALHTIIACAAPIIDQYEVAVGALVLTQPIPDGPFTPAGKKILIHAMSLLATLAATISAQLRLSDYGEKLADAESRVSIASTEAQRYESISQNLINTVKDELLVCSNDGFVTFATPGAAHIFKMSPDDLLGSSLSSLIEPDEPFDFEDLSKQSDASSVTIDDTPYTVKASRVLANDHTADGFIVSFKRVERSTLGVAPEKTGDKADIEFKDILGKSPQIMKAKSLAVRFAKSTENILLTGESGTGKELFAQSIHNLSRPNGPFMSVNCAAIPPRLIESELFGYEGGSFTGADRSGKPGKIELANKGTLFLDEIGDMPLELQATLLRVLENKRVMRVGGKVYRQIDFRLIAATNQNIPELVNQHRFREDLLFRISVLTVNIPPLRIRSDEPLYFARYFLNECNIKTGDGKAELSPEAINFISTYPWPGNVRQLKFAIYSAYYTCEGGIVKVSDFPTYITEGHLGIPQQTGPASSAEAENPSQNESSSSFKVPSSSDSRDTDTEDISETKVTAGALPTLSLKELEAMAIDDAMKRTDGDVPTAAALLGISKATLYRKLKESQDLSASS